MSLSRTPPRSLMASESGGGSTSNLSNYDEDEAQVNKNPRKRRPHTLEYDFKRDLMEFRSEIMNFLKETTNTQIENITKMRNEIRQDIQELKATTEKLTAEYKNLQKSVESITAEHKITQSKLITIEDEINKLKTDCHIQTTSFEKQQEIYQEIQNRFLREKNIVMVGLDEQNDTENITNIDVEAVHKILTGIYQDCPKPLKTIRLGKYNPAKSRPLKIIFETSNVARYLLKNRSKLTGSVKIYWDQTLAQRNYMQKLQIELKHREQNGESNLLIKYIKGVPTIVTIGPKTNSKN